MSRKCGVTRVYGEGCGSRTVGLPTAGSSMDAVVAQLEERNLSGGVCEYIAKSGVGRKQLSDSFLVCWWLSLFVGGGEYLRLGGVREVHQGGRAGSLC